MCDTEGPQPPLPFDITQEREFYKYFRPDELGLSHISRDETPTDAPSSPPRASPDRALTAFAQLATLRLNCRRAFISFFDRTRQYIVAEATKTLSLETLHASDPGDELKLGVCAVPKQGSLCENTVVVPVTLDERGKDVSSFVIGDCREDERFREKPYTLNAGFRFYAGVAIVSPGGHRIGSYCVVDDKPRKGLSDDELSFLKDMATTTMVHMEMVRSSSEVIKGETLVRGLGSFVEGKASISEWWMDPDQEDNTPSSHTPNTEKSSSKKSKQYSGRNSKWARQQYSLHHADTEHNPRYAHDQDRDEDEDNIFTTQSHDDTIRSDSEDEVKPISENPRSADTSKQDTLSVEVKATFGRATRIMREALDLDGVCCFDAKAGHTFGGLIDQQDNERPSRRKTSNKDNKKPELDQINENENESSQQSDDEEDKACEVLGFSTTDYSSINGDQANKVTDGMTETFLRSLLRRFSYGTILTFDEEGNLLDEQSAPSEVQESQPGTYPGTAKSQRLRSGEAAFIRKIFPQVRNLAIIPLWDSRQRFFSGCVAWTRSPYRILTHGELGYLAAFGDSIMAEVSRVDAKIADKAKSDFISSISHELRSPLHGILGSVECLQDSQLDPFQENLVHTVETCGKTLLDTIDHLLDFAKINNFTRKGGTKQQGNKKIALDVDVDLSVVTEEVLETVFAGHDFMKINTSDEDGQGPVTSSATSFAENAEKRRKSSATGVGGNGKHRDVSVVVDINKAEESHWIFRTQAGAWRRILMNLFGNSLKYTKEGFVQVKLDAIPLPKEGKASKSTVVLTVIDSGKGISQEYLEKSLFVPFAQEDSLQPGTGLGLAITAAIIRSMGGRIEVKSEQGHGTEIKVTLDMIHAPYSQESLEQSIISNAARRTKGLKVGFVGFDANSFHKRPDAEERSADNARHTFMSSFHRLCQNWFGMDMKIMIGLDQSDADIFLTTEQGLEQIQDQLVKVQHKQSEKDAQSAVKNTPLLVLCNSASIANYMLQNQRQGAGIAEYISQPCGPRKLAKSLVLCIDRLEASRDPNKTMPTVNETLGKESLVQEPPDGGKNSSENNATSKLSVRNKQTKDDPSASPDESKDDKESRPSDKSTMRPKNSRTTSARDPGTRPSAPNRQASSSGANTSSQTPPRKIRNIMLVDDNKINLQLLVTYMKKSQHMFTTAGDGQTALDAYVAQCEAMASNNTSGSSSSSSSNLSSSSNTKNLGATNTAASAKDNNQSSISNTDSNNDDNKTTTQSQTNLRPSPFDYILMDVSMPVMDGLESTRQIRAYERANNITPTTVIALTGLASAQAQQEAYGSGVNRFMTKPVKLKELGELLDRDEEAMKGADGAENERKGNKKKEEDGVERQKGVKGEAGDAQLKTGLAKMTGSKENENEKEDQPEKKNTKHTEKEKNEYTGARKK